MRNSDVCLAAGKTMIDLTPAAIGPYVVPVVNGDAHLGAANVNMVTCGGQATIPIVAAIARSRPCTMPRSWPPSPRSPPAPAPAPISTSSPRPPSRGIEKVGGAAQGKAIIILNPAEPPMIMRDTVFTLSSGADEAEIEAPSTPWSRRSQAYVPGYRLKQKVQFERFGSNNPIAIPGPWAPSRA